MDAIGVGALELSDGTGNSVAATIAFAFVGTVTAVDVAIAGPPFGDACGLVAALELRWPAGLGGAIAFIRAISTVIVTVTHPAHGDALPVSAGELVRRAGQSICGKKMSTPIEY